MKNYISEGRSIVKEIEADTYEENPPLFREYMSAPPDIKPIMDNQFKNVKTHARLLSKAMWYEWRMKLLEGLKEGLLKVGEGMDEDDRMLIQQEQMLEPVLPGLIERHEQLEKQVQVSQAQADELADCDQDELKDARDSLMSIDEELETKRKLIEELQTQLREKENILGDVLEQKQECVEEIKEAEKVRQDCRGWSSAEVSALQGNHGSIISVMILTDYLQSQCQRPRSRPRLDRRIRIRFVFVDDLPRHTSAFLHACVFCLREQNTHRFRKLPNKPHVYRRRKVLPPAAVNNRKALLLTNHARSTPMPATIPNQRQRSSRFRKHQLGNRLHHHRGSTHPWRELYHRTNHHL